ncbi:MAG: ferritin family protein [Planctomycetota bacterium]
MSITFNADEIFEIAEQIERNGAKFYREAAGNASDADVKELLLSMAAMEDGHEQIFAQMRKELPAADRESNVFDPDNEVALYLKTMADFHGTEGKVSSTERLTGNESLADILKIALQAEKNSIAFYVGVKDMLATKSGKEKVQAIIIEEMAHVATIGGKLQMLS